MEVWNAKNKGYVFQDKYFGRDLKVGRDFQHALMRYITSTANGEPTVLYHHIPTIYSKITQLGTTFCSLYSMQCIIQLMANGMG